MRSVSTDSSTWRLSCRSISHGVQKRRRCGPYGCCGSSDFGSTGDTPERGYGSRALKESREEATIFLVASGLTLYIAAVGIHQFESEAQPEHFGTLGQSLWWAVGLLVDVDYGEVWPTTFGGKAFTAVIALIGIAIIAVPAGLVASALTKIASEPSNGDPTTQSREDHDEAQ